MGCYRCSSNSNGDFDLGMCCLISSCLQSASYFRSVFCSTFTLIASRFDHIVSTVAACRCVSNIRAQLVLHCAKSCDQKRTVLLCFSRNILQRMHWQLHTAVPQNKLLILRNIVKLSIVSVEIRFRTLCSIKHFVEWYSLKEITKGLRAWP